MIEYLNNAASNKTVTFKLAGDVTTTNSNITFPAGCDVKLDLDGHKITSVGEAGRTFQVAKGAKVEVCGNGEMYSDSYGAFNVYGELIVRDGTYKAKGYSTGLGAVLRTQSGSKLTICDDVKVESEAASAIYCQGDVVAGRCELISYSYNGLTSLGQVYCALTYANSEFNDTTIMGVHGGLSSDGGTCVINGGTYGVYKDYKGADGQDTTSYYGLYITNGAQVTINGGTFNAGDNGYCVLNGDNDVNKPLGSPIIINDGTFNGWVGTSPAYEGNTVHGYIVNGGKFTSIAIGSHSLQECVKSGYELVQGEDGYYTLQKKQPVNLGAAKPFDKVEDGAVIEEKAGYYFDYVEEVTSPVTKANVSFTAEGKTIDKTLALPEITSGNISLSILLVGAPESVTGTIIFE